MKVSNGTVVKNLIWRYAERFLAQVVTFGVSLVLARILSPEEYGTVALVTVIVSILDVFSARGFNQALIQKAEVDHLDYSSVFLVNMLINILLYSGVFALAPVIAQFYNDSELTLLLRVLAIRILVLGFNSIQQAYVQRNMMFKKFFFSTTAGTVVSAVVGVYLALRGAGAWALVVQSLTNTFIDTIVLFFSIDWKPKLEFSFMRIRRLFGFGARNMVMGMIDSVYNQLRSLTIGKIYTTGDLAYYDKGKNLPAMVVDNVQISASNVFFSALSREKTHEDVKEKMRLYLRMMYYIMCPALIGLVILAKPIIILLYSEKWVYAVPFLMIYCLAYLTWVPQIPMLQAINSRGKAEVILNLTIINRAVGVILLIAFLKWGPIYIALGELLSNIFITVLVFAEAKRIFGYRVTEFVHDIMNTSFLAVIMSVTVLFVEHNVEACVLQVILGVIVGATTYIIISFVTKNQNFLQIIHLLKKRG